MNVQKKLIKTFEKVKNLYGEEELLSELLAALQHSKTYKNACEHMESIHTLPHMLSDVASFILGWCHGNEFIEKKLISGELTINEIMDALFVCVILAEDHHE